MRKKFSERYHFKNPRKIFQIDFIDDALRNRLWNQVQYFYFDTLELETFSTLEPCIRYSSDLNFFKQLYDEFFKSDKEVDSYIKYIKKDIKQRFFSFEWYEIYDFIEYISEIYHNSKLNEKFKTKVNQVLEDEMSGYRFVGNFIVPIIDDTEIEAIEETLKCEYTGVKIHLSNALELLSDKKNPDYINSIKESISAVESAINLISDKKNIALNRCIQEIPFEIDKNFNSAMIKLYSWTSSEDGIRHGNTGKKINSSFAEAKFMLVTCSAFINYLINKKEEIKR